MRELLSVGAEEPLRREFAASADVSAPPREGDKRRSMPLFGMTGVCSLSPTGIGGSPEGHSGTLQKDQGHQGEGRQVGADGENL